LALKIYFRILISGGKKRREKKRNKRKLSLFREEIRKDDLPMS